MHFLKYFYIKTIKYDFINKFNYKKINKIPKIKKIIVNFGCKKSEIKQLISSLLALELITNQPGILTQTKYPNMLLKIKKGNPTGCKVTLRKQKMLTFLLKNTVNIFPKLKDFDGFQLIEKNNNGIFSYELNEIFSFNELEKQYYLFNNISKLSITLITNCNIKEELIFLLKSFRLPCVNCADITQMVECNLAKIKVKGSNPFIC